LHKDEEVTGQIGTDKMLWTNVIVQNSMDKMLLCKMIRTEWYGQNGSNFRNRL